jgi:hypothetical protein
MLVAVAGVLLLVPVLLGQAEQVAAAQDQLVTAQMV